MFIGNLTQGVALGWYTHASTRILPLQGVKKYCLDRYLYML